MTKYLTRDLRGMSSSLLGSIVSGLVLKQNILTGIVGWNIVAPLMTEKKTGRQDALF